LPLPELIMPTTREAVTRLLTQPHEPVRDPTDELIPIVYDELRALAHHQLSLEAGPRSLCTTELVHEAYLKLADGDRVGSKGRAYFFGAAARAMRRILIERARRRSRLKRGGDRQRITLDAVGTVDEFAEQLLDLDLALGRFERIDPRAARVVEFHFFGGLTMKEIATAIAVSPRTVKRDWSTAKAWLYRALQEAE
jgi:RNA polymerase sigma-70 factor (ECF subfamily)